MKKKNMILFYLIHQALEHLKRQIEEYEKKLEKTKNEYRRKNLEEIIEWIFERGLNMLKYADETEVNQKTIDWYLNRIKERPDIESFKRRLKYKMRERGRVRELPDKCPICGSEIIMIPAGISRRTGKAYGTFWVCEKDCGFTCNSIKGGYECTYPKNKIKER